MVQFRRLNRLGNLLVNEARWQKSDEYDQRNWGERSTCAVWLACQFPDLRKEGLGCEIVNNQLTPTFEGQTGIKALDEFFDIDGTQAHDLFVKSEKSSPTDLAEKIRVMILIERGKKRK